MLENIKKLIYRYREIIKYLFFGVATTIVNWIVYSAAIYINDNSMLICNTLAWCVAVLFAFITNKLWVFESRSWNSSLILKELIMFVGARIITGVFEIIGPSVLYAIGFTYSLFDIKGFWAKAAMSVIVIVLNYVFSKKLIFKTKGGSS